MEYLDEKIALYRRQHRIEQRRKQEEAEIEKMQKEYLNKNTQEDNQVIKPPVVSLIELRKGIREGIVILNEKKLNIKKELFFEGRLPMFIPEEFLVQDMKQDNVFMFVNDLYGISLLCTFLEKNLDLKPIAERQQDVENNMIKLGMYAKEVKSAELEQLDYMCFLSPTGKGKVYNLLFWVHKNEECRIFCNFNCMEKEKDTYGILLEAMILEINESLKEM